MSIHSETSIVSKHLKNKLDLSGLFESLTANHLSTAGVEVYRSIVTSMSVNVWKGHFLAHLIRAITSEDGNVQNNVRNSRLPVTLKYVKGSNEAVMSELAENDYLAKLMIIKSNRILGVTSQLSDLVCSLQEHKGPFSASHETITYYFLKIKTKLRRKPYLYFSVLKIACFQ